MPIRIPFEQIKLIFEKNGFYITLIPYYVNSKTRIPCICEKGHKLLLSYNDITHNHGCKFCKRHKITDENRLSTLFPEIAKEWHPIKNEGIFPDQIERGSNKLVWWICKDCGNEWKSSPNRRTSKHPLGGGCPKCGRLTKVTDDNKLSIHYPKVSLEWHKTLNGLLTPDKISFNSSKNVWWKCNGCRHEWEMSPRNRTIEKYPSGCGICSGRILSDKNRLSIIFPELIKEWDYEKNFPLTPDQVSYASGSNVYWKCSKEGCGHVWQALVSSRTRSGSGCPSCSGRAVSNNNRLSVIFPELIKEWDYEKNFPLTPDDVSFASNKFVYWKCINNLGHNSFKSRISDKTGKKIGKGCPYCASKIVTDEKRLSLLFPEIIKEWNYEKNFPLAPEQFTYGSDKKVWWVCSGCGGEYEASIKSKAKQPIGTCQNCHNTSVSKISQKCFDNFNIPKKYREKWLFLSNKKIRVDAFIKKDNLVIEFLGTFWHGDLRFYPADKIHPFRKISMQELYNETLNRLQELKNSGYIVKYIWESDYLKGKSLETF